MMETLLDILLMNIHYMEENTNSEDALVLCYLVKMISVDGIVETNISTL